MRKWRNWQTRTFEGRVEHSIRVQVPSSAFSLGPRGPFVFLSPLSSLLFSFSPRSHVPLRRDFLFCLRADACRDGSTKSIVFFACAAGGQEDPQAGPSCQSPGPKGEGGAPPPPLDSTSTPSGTSSCIILKLRSMGAKQCHTRITGAVPR